MRFEDRSPEYPTEWLWTFEGGTPASSTEQNPTVFYETAGKYDVTLKVTNAVGESTEVFDTLITVLSLPEQVRLAQETHIFVTSCGGGVMTATFLPPGASLIVYYNSVGGYDYKTDQFTGGPARLDWDLLNNAGHLRVHWLPIASMNTTQDLELLGLLLQHEASVMSRDF